ncbi:MAG: TIGR02996 domain-containing protein [Gemmata sp.]
MPASEEHAFLAAIVAHPNDDTPRLVLADWLAQHDAPGDAHSRALPTRTPPGRQQEAARPGAQGAEDSPRARAQVAQGTSGRAC